MTSEAEPQSGPLDARPRREAARGEGAGSDAAAIDVRGLTRRFGDFVGDRVRDVFGHEATVTVIDVRAAQGAGVITVKYDDGRTAQSMALAHGFERVNA